MGLFNFGKKEKKESIKWNRLTEIKQLDEIVEISKEKPVLLFKHSTRCSISSMALSRIEQGWKFSEEEVLPFYLDLIAYRDVSNAVANKFDIFHQSPQLILIKEGKPVLDASHNSINTEIIKEAL